MALFGVIPARYASTRFPGKPLALIHGKPMIQWVYERAMCANLQHVVVATDDDRIAHAVAGFGGVAIMTSPHHNSGTDRCAEVANILKINEQDVVVNIQGDEPFIQKEAINLLIQQFQNPNVEIATLAKSFLPDENPQNPNMVKVVTSKNNKALYFSRAQIPFYRNLNIAQTYLKHVGIYAYRNDILQQLTLLSPSNLENAEQLEQLRWLENDYSINVSLCNYESISIDTPDDLIRAENLKNINL